MVFAVRLNPEPSECSPTEPLPSLCFTTLIQKWERFYVTVLALQGTTAWGCGSPSSNDSSFSMACGTLLCSLRALSISPGNDIPRALCAVNIITWVSIAQPQVVGLGCKLDFLSLSGLFWVEGFGQQGSKMLDTFMAPSYVICPIHYPPQRTGRVWW